MKHFLFLLFGLLLVSCSEKVMTINRVNDTMYVNLSKKEITFSNSETKHEFATYTGLANFIEMATYVGDEEVVYRMESLINNDDIGITIYPTIDTNGIVLNPIGEVFLDYYNTSYDDSGIKNTNYSKSIGYFCELVKHPLFENKQVFFTEAWSCN